MIDFFKLQIKRAKNAAINKPVLFVEYMQNGIGKQGSLFRIGGGRSEKKLPNLNWKQFDGVEATTLIGVCDGLLMFKMNPNRGSLIVNPITQESRIIPVANEEGTARCLYFDRFEDDYKLLHLSGGRTNTIQRYLIYSFNRGVWTRIKSVDTHHYFQPRFGDPPAVVSDALHWTGYCYFGCSMMVLVFNIQSKDFSLLPYPTAVITKLYTETNCCVSDGSDNLPLPHYSSESIQLIEKDGKLCLCHTTGQREVIEVWFLQNYGDWGSWARTYIAILNDGLNGYCDFCKESIKIASFNGDDILISWPCGGPYLYSLETKKFTIIAKSKLPKPSTIISGPIESYNCMLFTPTLLSPNNVYTTL